MSTYEQFCESLRAGQISAQEEQLRRAEEERSLPPAVGDVIRRLGASFRCPAGRVRYVDTQANLVTGTLEGALPPIRYSPEKGRHCLDVEIGVGDRPAREPYPVWVHLEFVPLRHGGLEFHFGRGVFRAPDEEGALFNHIAGAINHELRKGCAPGPRKVGFGAA
jgi:hypothetical protein